MMISDETVEGEPTRVEPAAFVFGGARAGEIDVRHGT
jgi:hypothetical protein